MSIPASPIVSRRLEGLKELFQDCDDTLYLRGSYARGDNYCADIDISAYNEAGAIQMANPPTEFNGLKINYGGISLEDFESYFAICPRGGSSMMEMQPIVIGHNDVINAYDRQVKQYLGTRIPNYLLFLLVEEETNGRIADRTVGSDYFSLKRQRGSKRTISRIIWGSKSREFDYLFSLSHEDVLNKLVDHGEMPQKVAASCLFILKNAHLDPSSEIWSAHRACVVQWYYEIYVPSIIMYLLGHIPQNVIHYSFWAARADTALVDVLRAYELSKQLSGQLRWIMLFALSGSWKLPVKYLIEIWQEFRYDAAYRNIVRNLIANVTMPDDLINPSEFSDNKLMLRAYDIRLQLKRHLRLPGS